MIRKPTFNILCLDPSLRAFGWAVVTGMKVRAAGCISTESNAKLLRIRKGDDNTHRISIINLALKDVIEKYSIAFIVSELPHGSQSASAATALGLVTGAVQAAADFLDIGLEWFSEADSKNNALGKATAKKEEMINKMKTIYKLKWADTKYIDEAVADALAIHYVARKFSPVLKAMK